MALLDTLPVGPEAARWPLWSTVARVVVTDPRHLAGARAAIDAVTDRVEAACSRFRPDSELSRLPRDGSPAAVSPLLAELVGVALTACARSGGDVDPALGADLAALGYDRDLALVAGDGRWPVAARPAAPGVRLRDGVLTVASGRRLDLGATAKAWAADAAARDAAAVTGGGVLVSLGGDIAVAGPAPVGGWQVRVQDGPGEAAQVVAVATGAVATSSTLHRTWTCEGRTAHHVLDPRTGAPARTDWRTVTVAADRCVDANTLATASIVRGLDALPWLRRLGVPARLVGAGGKVVTIGGWPR